ncbi:MAG: SUMF1/EgtB/PvdO family nonheme iron enzyme [Acidobacteriota bacterium]
MFCTSCGQTISDGLGKCPECGALLRTAILTDTSEKTSDAMKTSITPPEVRGGGSSEVPEGSEPTDASEATGSIRPRAVVNAGRVLGGRYQLDAAIGSGGMGDIYRARRLHIGDTVAVKVLRPEVVDNAQSRQRFYREARAAAMLHHPNAVVIHDFGEDSDGTAYIVMELLEGHSLRQVLIEEGTVSPERVLDIVRQGCAALEAAHRGGIVHRDIKPDNIMLMDTHSGAAHVKILDFGIAKLRDKALDTLSLEKNLTNVGTVIGTPHYMSPEQCQGEPADARSDIYSLGVVTYEMLTGVTPFVAKTPTGVAIKHVTEPPRPLTELRPELSPAIERVVLRALHKEPDARQQTALEFAQEFTIALRGESATSEFNTSSERYASPSVSSIERQAMKTPEPATPPSDTARFPSSADHGDAGTAKLGEKGFETQISLPDSTDTLRKPAPTSGIAKTPKGKTQKAAKGTANKSAPVVPAPAKVAEAPVIAKKSVATEKKPLPIRMIGIAAAGIVLLALAGWLIARKSDEGATGPAVSSVPSPVASVESTAVVPAVPTPPLGMVYVPGGEFTLGRDDGEADEKPARVVAVKPLFMDQTEVSNEQYQKFLDETKYPAPPNWAGGRFPEGTEKLPVTNVTWEDAMTYAKAVGKRLPTEEEWEFSARGTDGRLFPWGNDWAPDRSNTQSRPNEKRQVQPVGQYPQGASPFGLLDLSGNVWEWTASDYVAYPGGFIEPPPKGFSNLKVIRGGSFESPPKGATATLRPGWPATRSDFPTPGKADYSQTGFRCAQDIPRP